MISWECGEKSDILEISEKSRENPRNLSAMVLTPRHQFSMKLSLLTNTFEEKQSGSKLTTFTVGN